MAAEAINVRVSSPSYQAYQILHIAYTVAPIVAGIDKFYHFLVNWDTYLAPIVPRTLGITAHSFMLGVGVIEVIAGLLVAVVPRYGGWVVGVWLIGIVVNLLSIPAYFDIALRDFGLALGAFALSRLSVDYSPV
jgi:hypothetical protein